jgi:hypothetical protein
MLHKWGKFCGTFYGELFGMMGFGLERGSILVDLGILLLFFELGYKFVLQKYDVFIEASNSTALLVFRAIDLWNSLLVQCF